MEQLVLLVIIGLISLINWLMQRSAQMREKRKLERGGLDGQVGPSIEVPEPAGRPEEDPDESMRRLMEALGIPSVEEEPEPAPPPPLPQVRRGEVPQPVFTPPPPVVTVPRARVRPGLAAVVEQREPTRFRKLLSSKGGLRDAVVLSEILGPPRSLRSP
jgi:hypothetical protein